MENECCGCGKHLFPESGGPLCSIHSHFHQILIPTYATRTTTPNWFLQNDDFMIDLALQKILKIR